MATEDFVLEVLMDEWPEWPGNELYSTKELAEYFGIEDFMESFYEKWIARIPDAAEPGEFHWEFISKGLYHLLEDGFPTGVSMKFRHVHGSWSKA